MVHPETFPNDAYLQESATEFTFPTQINISSLSVCSRPKQTVQHHVEVCVGLDINQARLGDQS